MKLCRQCGKFLKKKYNIFCDIFCSAKYNAKKKKRTTNRIVSCKNCGIPVISFTRIFCGHSCRAKFYNTGRKKSEESKKKTSESTRRFQKSHPEMQINLKIAIKEYWEIHKRKVHERICAACKERFFDNSKKYCSRECYKLGCQEKATRALIKGIGKCGTYKGIYCQSTWELAFLIWAIDNNFNIRRCRLTIPYTFLGKSRLYIPDFIIEDTIYEIKGWVTEIAVSKQQAAVNQGYNIILIDGKEIQKYLLYVNDKYQINIEKDYMKFYERN